MEGTGPTKNQLMFIKKLRESSSEREEALNKFLREYKKGDVEELSIKETSQLIDELKKIKVQGDTTETDTFATGKQITFLTRLQDSDERIKATEDFLLEKGKGSVNLLSLSEASELIDTLTKLKGTDSGGSEGNAATKKQISFIRNLQKNDKGLVKTTRYLKELKKGSIEELTSREASSLIDRLKSQ